MIYDVRFETADQYFIARVEGPATLEGNLELTRALNEYSDKGGKKRILIDIRKMTDLTGIFDVYKLSEVAASLAKGKFIKIGILHGMERKEQISFLETASRNRGVNVRVFMDEEKCLEWLLNSE